MSLLHLGADLLGLTYLRLLLPPGFQHFELGLVPSELIESVLLLIPSGAYIFAELELIRRRQLSRDSARPFAIKNLRCVDELS